VCGTAPPLTAPGISTNCSGMSCGLTGQGGDACARQAPGCHRRSSGGPAISAGREAGPQAALAAGPAKSPSPLPGGRVPPASSITGSPQGVLPNSLRPPEGGSCHRTVAIELGGATARISGLPGRASSRWRLRAWRLSFAPGLIWRWPARVLRHHRLPKQVAARAGLSALAT